MFLCNSITQALAHVTKLFPADTGRRPARQFLISQLETFTRYLSPESHEDLDTREPLEVLFEMDIIKPDFELVLHGQLNSVVKGIYLTFLREKA